MIYRLIEMNVLKIAWLYPELMSTYGDRGNIICLQKRCQWRGIRCQVEGYEGNGGNGELERADLIFGGGAQDRQQEIVMRDLTAQRVKLQNLLERGVPGLFVCGAPQLLGRPFLGLFDMETVFPKNKLRLIGNLVTKIELGNLGGLGDFGKLGRTIVGFENHGGRTYLGKGVKPLAKVIKGFGNNGEDGTEGAVYRNWLATYMHGPFLSKNPHVADWLIKTALEVKYRKSVELKPLDDSLEWKAHEFVLKNR